MNNSNPNDDPAYGVAMASVGLWLIIAAKLQNTGIMSQAEIEEGIDVAMYSLETLGIPAHSAAGKSAHGVLDMLLATVRGRSD